MHLWKPTQSMLVHEGLQCKDQPVASGFCRPASQLKHKDGGTTGRHDTPVSCQQAHLAASRSRSALTASMEGIMNTPLKAAASPSTLQVQELGAS